jgi:hypothetical protein
MQWQPIPEDPALLAYTRNPQSGVIYPALGLSSEDPATGALVRVNRWGSSLDAKASDDFRLGSGQEIIELFDPEHIRIAAYGTLRALNLAIERHAPGQGARLPEPGAVGAVVLPAAQGLFLAEA